MSNSPEHFMQEALKVAAEGLEKGELPIGAVVVLDGQVIARAHTAERAERRMLVHAELLALLKADELVSGTRKRANVTLFTTLEPCLMCMGAAMSFFLGRIYYALEAPGDGAVSLAHQWRRKEENFPAYRVPSIEGGLLRQESLELFKAYVKNFPSAPQPLWEWAKTLVTTLEHVVTNDEN
ncbi:nucleoside deaminase [Ktedonosporobacter rubrisoli]|uniref:Nucleoside deaminase n=1 Tax=Ktedonosporobacter rubrisoli TaxID=2509675 RepID=A0A4P6JPA8_KTERU|nr:nucleoside deaminase [Ktedonosporobacter rubrisoli]QBD76596.1 nucleoside deaminase [Ktedonosporobacter rubrisoli]